ncbi:pyridoxamine 5'-phosphate oxidase family protein [Sphingosinicella sp. LHD-64]|uniref:pyridoxamine 5'-phosphate oxidase family protein n=1 Tax=Sphingosinicella sp. LHD-64 TaxID=3072139 RepID=UPI00280C98E0|nr:pyridoxamine 5'-phosphate oxidase family protein [Sphingosinicella sp. LHD-64]MDQ8755254.1 pyridoxamine 5'-phosphate oxidase family protein [Sphingosinicella sp. LHD-64]
MPDSRDIEARFWSALEDDKTVMLGLAGRSDGHAQPMTALLDEGESRAIWFFTAKDVDLVRALGAGGAAVLQFASKGHDLFASVEGRLSPSDDRGAVDRLWNSFVAAWFEGGKDDPKLQLLRFDPAGAQIWLNENSLFAGVKLLLGADPKKDYRDKVAEVDLA